MKYIVKNTSGDLFHTDDLNEARRVMHKFNDDIKHNKKNAAYIHYSQDAIDQINSEAVAIDRSKFREQLRKVAGISDYLEGLKIKWNMEFKNTNGINLVEQAENNYYAAEILGSSNNFKEVY